MKLFHTLSFTLVLAALAFGLGGCGTNKVQVVVPEHQLLTFQDFAPDAVPEKPAYMRSAPPVEMVYQVPNEEPNPIPDGRSYVVTGPPAPGPGVQSRSSQIGVTSGSPSATTSGGPTLGGPMIAIQAPSEQRQKIEANINKWPVDGWDTTLPDGTVRRVTLWQVPNQLVVKEKGFFEWFFTDQYVRDRGYCDTHYNGGGAIFIGGGGGIYRGWGY